MWQPRFWVPTQILWGRHNLHVRKETDLKPRCFLPCCGPQSLPTPLCGRTSHEPPISATLDWLLPPFSHFYCSCWTFLGHKFSNVKDTFLKPTPEDMFIDFRERGREKETSIHCFPHTLTRVPTPDRDMCPDRGRAANIEVYRTMLQPTEPPGQGCEGHFWCQFHFGG